MSNNIFESCLQARYSAGCYTGRKKDKRVGNEVAKNNDVETSVGNYWKNTLKCSELSLIQSIAAGARDEYYRFSTEWLEGVRVMPVDAYYKFAPSYKNYKSEHSQAIEAFVGKYTQLVQEAKKTLKDLWDESDYPRQEEIASKFHMDFRIFPFPDVDNDFRVQLIKEEIEEAKNTIRKSFEEAQRSASVDLFSRIEERMEKVYSTLADPNKKIYDSMFQHTVALCEDIKVLNFTNNQDIETLRKEMLDKLGSIYPDIMRTSSGVPGGQRELASQAAKDILSRVNQMKGVF